MELCFKKHDEVCFEGGECHVCSIRDELEDEIKDLRKDLAAAEKAISDLENQ